MLRRRAVPFLPLAVSLSWRVSGLASEARGTGPEEKSGTPPAIAVGDYEVPGVEVALLSVKRVSDGSLTVKWEYRNKTDSPKKLGESFKSSDRNKPYCLVYNAYLVDARNKMKYPVAKDARGDLVAGKHGGHKNVFVLAPRKTLETWAKSLAVHAGVRKISVFIPGVQPFEDVAISD